MIKLNLGCWKRNFPGFINIDVIGYPHIHFQRDAKDLSVFDDETVDLIYASHVLEYFTLNDAYEALREWRRVLKPGGELRVAVPDFSAMVEVYQKYKDVLLLRGAILAITDKVVEIEGKPVIHKMLYDERVLRRMLEECGFTEIEKYNWKEFLPEGVVDRSASYYPKKDEKNGILISLNLKAKKAGSVEAAIQSCKHTSSKLAKRVIKKAKSFAKGEFVKHKELYKI